MSQGSTEILPGLRHAVNDAVSEAAGALAAAKKLQTIIDRRGTLDVNALAILKDRYRTLGLAVKLLREAAEHIRRDSYLGGKQ